MLSGIYVIENQINFKKYYGSSFDIKQRIYDHKRLLNKNKHYNIHLQNAWNKYGEDNFEFSLVFLCPPEKTYEIEQWFLDNIVKWGHDYNLAITAEGGSGKHTKETKEKISKMNREFYKNHPEMRLFLSNLAKQRNAGEDNPMYGKTGEEAPMFGVKRPEHSKRMSGSNNPSSVKVKCIEKDLIFDTAREASKFCGLKYSTTIIKCCRGKVKTAGGYTWEYVD